MSIRMVLVVVIVKMYELFIVIIGGDLDFFAEVTTDCFQLLF